MHIVIVHVSVKEDMVAEFISATKENAENSLQEPGVVVFDCIQQKEASDKFILIEGYLDENAPLAHKETAHYKKWREIVAPMMAEDRYSVKYQEIFPEHDRWLEK